MREAFSIALAIVGMAACGGDDAARDGGPPDGGSDPGVVIPPDIPWLDVGAPPVAFTPCPAGWREVSDEDGITTCDPYPEGGPSECAFGEAHFPGEPGCRPIGDPCPVGDYAAKLPTEGPVVYVNATATPGTGDGSLASPYASLREVSWISLAPDTTVALAKGTYEGVVLLEAGVRVLGACVAETILTGLDAPVPEVISVTQAGAAAHVRNVAIVDPPQVASIVVSGRTLSYEGVLVDGAWQHSVGAIDAGSTLLLTDVVVRRTRDTPGRAMEVIRGARVEGTRVIFEDNRDEGLAADGAGTRVVLNDAVIRDTESGAGGVGGRGIGVQAGASFEGSRIAVIGNRDVGFRASGSESTVSVSDVVIRGTRSRAVDSAGGRGIELETGVSFNATRLACSENREVGLFANGVGTTVTLADVVVRDTASRESDLGGGRGLSLVSGAALQATRLAVTRNHDVGVFVTFGSTVALTDAVVRDTAVRESDALGGRGIGAQEGSRVDATRVLFSNNREVSVFVSDSGTSVSLTDAVVRDTRPQEGPLALGWAILSQNGGRTDLSRTLVADALELGVTASFGGILQGQDVSIERVAPCDCPVVWGYAAAAWGGEVSLRGFAIRDSATCGLFIAPYEGLEGSLDVESGIVERAAIGACVQVDGYDIGRVSRDVVYRDNGVNLETTMLPVPAPVAPIEP